MMNNTITTKAVKDMNKEEFAAYIQKVYEASKRDISTISDDDLAYMYEYLNKHRGWLFYISENDKQLAAKIIDEMEVAFDKYIPILEETGFEGYVDEDMFKVLYEVTSIMTKSVEEYFTGKMSRDGVHEYWNETYVKYMIELTRRLKKLGIKDELDDCRIERCAELRCILAYLERNKYSKESCYKVAEAYWKENFYDEEDSFEEALEEFRDDIELAVMDFNTARKQMKKQLKEMEKELTKYIADHKKYKKNRIRDYEIHKYGVVFKTA